MITWNPFKLLDGDEKEDQKADYTGPARDPFDAVPIRHELAKSREDSKGQAQIRLRVIPTGTGMGPRVARRLGFHRDLRADLDQHGTFFWSLIDGKRNLHEIEKLVRKEFDLSEDDSRQAVLTFTKMLMMRHFIQLDLLGRPETNEASTAEAISHVG